MRKVFTLIATGFLFLHTSAQQLSNGGFESWAGGTPQSWSTSHSIISASTLETQETSIVYQGTSAIKLVGGTVPAPAGIPYAGFVHYGTAYYDNSQQDFIMNGISFPYRPDSLQFAYKYTPSGSDSGNVFCNLYKGSIGNIIGYVNMNLGTSASYKLVTVPVSYLSAQMPDSLNLVFYSGSLFPPVTGSTLYVDAVKFIYNSGTPSTIENVTESEIRVYPNPATSRLYLNVSDKAIGSTVRIYSVLGSEMINEELPTSHNAVNISSLDDGMYIYRILDKSAKVLYAGKFTKE